MLCSFLPVHHRHQHVVHEHIGGGADEGPELPAAMVQGLVIFLSSRMLFLMVLLCRTEMDNYCIFILFMA